jgi:hypothetical protein
MARWWRSGYRADPWDKIVAAASWLQRAHRARDPVAGNEWFALAVAVYEHEYQTEQNHDWWKDFGAGNFGKLAAFNLMRLAPADARFHGELQLYATRFCEYRKSPGGLRLREPWAHEYGSLRHANNAAVIALYYSDHVLTAPPIPGNTWWKANRSNAELQELYRTEARRTVDYALGANPYGRSYLVGFGNQPFNHVHHRGAYGAWAGFEHFVPGKADDRTTNRHILYGALVAGPDSNDVFLCGNRRQWLEVPGTKDFDVFYRFASRPTPVRKTGYVWAAEDPPYQDVMDSQFNEVALDYNAGITASFAGLLAHGLGSGHPVPDAEFPTKEMRQSSDDLRTTDREYFVAARRVGGNERSARTRIHPLESQPLAIPGFHQPLLPLHVHGTQRTRRQCGGGHSLRGADGSGKWRDSRRWKSRRGGGRVSRGRDFRAPQPWAARTVAGQTVVCRSGSLARPGRRFDRRQCGAPCRRFQVEDVGPDVGVKRVSLSFGEMRPGATFGSGEYSGPVLEIPLPTLPVRHLCLRRHFNGNQRVLEGVCHC